VLAHVVLTSESDAMLGAFEVTAPPRPEGGGISTGTVTLTRDLSNSPIPGFDLALALPPTGVDVPFKLKLEPAAGPTGLSGREGCRRLPPCARICRLNWAFRSVPFGGYRPVSARVAASC
jgi:hypothetical protein